MEEQETEGHVYLKQVCDIPTACRVRPTTMFQFFISAVSGYSILLDMMLQSRGRKQHVRLGTASTVAHGRHVALADSQNLPMH